jgi:hypothetical protein
MQKIVEESSHGRPAACVELHPKIGDDLGWVKRQAHCLAAVEARDVDGAVVERFFYGLGRPAATALSKADGVTQPEKAGRVG